MNKGEQVFHAARRAFIIMENSGVLLAPVNSKLSHQEMLTQMGFSVVQTVQYLNELPRGYCMNGELCVYQGVSDKSKTWELQPKNYKIVQRYLPDLCALFNLNDNSNLYLGVLVGRVGEVWKKINKTTISDFMKTR